MFRRPSTNFKIGDVLWAWVPFEEDPKQGKDRPVLVIGIHGKSLLSLPMTSKDHDRDAAQEAANGRHWQDIGSGSWDRKRRNSEVRLDRQILLSESQIRRKGGKVSNRTITEVLRAVAKFKK